MGYLLAHRLSKAFLRPLIPARPEDAHKGTFGSVLVIAGSRGFTGAARLTTEAAHRSGAGLVMVAAPEPLRDVVANTLLEATSILLPATEAESFASQGLATALAEAGKRQAVVIGPGMGRHRDTEKFIRDFVRQCPVSMVVDADALNALEGDPDALREAKSSVVITPHPGEMARLTHGDIPSVQGDRENMALRFAAEHNCVVCLKGFETIIANPDGEAFLNPTGTSGLATGGTGDVLAGLLAGLMAQGMQALPAAQVGVYLHGLAGSLAAKEFTERAMLARDVLAALSKAWHDLEQGVEK